MKRELGVSAEWLLEGEGEPFVVHVTFRDPEGWTGTSFRSATPMAHQWITSKELRNIEEFLEPKVNVIVPNEAESLFDADSYEVVPLFKSIEAVALPEIPTGSLAFYIPVHRAVCLDPRSFRCVRLQDKTMEPFLPKDTIVGIDLSLRDLQKSEGRIVCARDAQGNVFIRRFQLAETAVGDEEPHLHAMLLPLNPDAKAHVLIDLSTMPDPIIGTVVFAWLDLRK